MAKKQNLAIIFTGRRSIALEIARMIRKAGYAAKGTGRENAAVVQTTNGGYRWYMRRSK